MYWIFSSSSGHYNFTNLTLTKPYFIEYIVVVYSFIEEHHHIEQNTQFYSISGHKYIFGKWNGYICRKIYIHFKYSTKQILLPLEIFIDSSLNPLITTLLYFQMRFWFEFIFMFVVICKKFIHLVILLYTYILVDLDYTFHLL